MDIIYWSVRLSRRRGGDGVKGVAEGAALFLPAVASFFLSEYIIMWCILATIKKLLGYDNTRRRLHTRRKKGLPS